MNRHRTIATWVLVATLLLAPGITALADGPSREYQVKAAFVFNFSQFIDWPEDTFVSKDWPFVVAIVGQDPFDGAMEQAMAGKFVGTHPIVVKHFSSTDKLDQCQILFVPAAEEASVTENLRRVIGNSPVLMVGESDTFLPAGGTIRFYTEDKKMRFEVNLQAAEKARLKISSKLLRLAKIYKG